MIRYRNYIILLVVIFLGLSLVIRFVSQFKSPLEQVVHKLNAHVKDVEEDFNQFVQDKGDFTDWIDGDFLNQYWGETSPKPYDVLVYKDNQLIFWSSNKVDVSGATLSKLKLSPQYVQLRNGYYAIFKKIFLPSETGGSNLQIIGTYLLKNNYTIENKYLENRENQVVSGIAGIGFSEEQMEESMPLTTHTESTLWVYHKNTFRWSTSSYFILAFQLISSIIILLVLFFLACYFARSYPFIFVFPVLVGALLLLKWLIYQFGFPLDVSHLQIFARSPEAPLFSSSIGDFLVNSLILFVLSLFLFQRFNLSPPFRTNRIKQEGLYLSISTAFFLFIFVVLSAVRSLIMNSAVSFSPGDVVSFTPLTLLGFALCGLLMLSLFLLGQKTATYLNKLNVNLNNRLKYGLLFLLYLILWIFLWGINVVVILSFLWSLLFIIYLPRIDGFAKAHLNVAQLAFWVVFFSLSVSSLLYWADMEKEQKLREDQAYTVVKEEDRYAEFLFEDIAVSIINDGVIKSYYRTPFLSKNEIEKRIRQRYFGDYFDHYNIEIIAFNKHGYALNGDEGLNIKDFQKRISDYGIKSKNSYLHHISNPTGGYSYLANLPVFHDNQVIGHIIVELDKHTPKLSSIYPELLIGEKYSEDRLGGQYNFAIYKYGILENYGGEYVYPYIAEESFESEEEFSHSTINQYSHLVYQPNEEVTVIISKKKDFFSRFLSLFSYSFFLISLSVFIYIVVDSLLHRKTGGQLMRRLFFSSLTKRISSVMLATIVFSFLVIGLVTIAYFSERSIQYHKDRLYRKQKAVLSAIEQVAQNKETLISSRDELNDLVQELAEIHSINFHIYDLDGRLLSSSRPLIFDRGIVSKNMNAHAFQKMEKFFERLIIQNEDIGGLDYLASYTQITDEIGDKLAYLNVPYFTGEQILRSDISNFLVTIINVYVLIMIGAAFLTFLVSKSVTRSLNMIGDRLQDIKLGQKNEKLFWPDDDEIGALVEQYNHTIDELELSAKRLAQSERHFAWQQMAKQVAHEIKNPLTPMKLSIQHLSRAQQENHPNIKELTGRVTKTLIEQIDHLAHIASEFSSFAKMPKAREEDVDLKEMVNSISDLYKESKSVKIVKMLPEESINILADRSQLTRVFHNLIKNSIQAMPDNKQGIIIINAKLSSGRVVLSFADNGTGIPEDKKDMVFVPNFTTKTSGMGLGLAICKNIIENMGGEIYFESVVNQGTTFFLEIPVRS